MKSSYRSGFKSGNFRDVEELIHCGLQSFNSEELDSKNSQLTLQAAVDQLRELRQGVTLGGLKIQDLAHEGHRY